MIAATTGVTARLPGISMSPAHPCGLRTDAFTPSETSFEFQYPCTERMVRIRSMHLFEEAGPPMISW